MRWGLTSLESVQRLKNYLASSTCLSGLPDLTWAVGTALHLFEVTLTL